MKKETPLNPDAIRSLPIGDTERHEIKRLIAEAKEELAQKEMQRASTLMKSRRVKLTR